MSTAAHIGEASGYTARRNNTDLNGVCVEGFKIKDCFALFFQHYHPMLPILDPSWDPDSFYKLSPFVFWCLLITGSRRYELDPTILDRLAPIVKQLSLEALGKVPAYFPTICGLLILCTWPLPMNSVWEDPSPTLSGAAMQLALRHGLHMFTKQHASPRPATFRDITQQASLARVWAYLQFVCHCTSWTTGSPPHCLTDAFDLVSENQELASSIPPSIFWMQEFESTCNRASITLTELIQSRTPSSAKKTLHGIIKVFDDQILNISEKPVIVMQTKASGSGTSLLPNSLITSIARIYVNSFHFFGSDISLHFPDLMELYYLACQWTQQASEADHSTDWALYSSESYFRQMLLVATIILRISRSHQLKSKVDLRQGERAYFSTVRLLRKRSLSTNDVNAHTANVLSELWNSDHCFKLLDGSYESLAVPVSGHGVMGVAYDCLWSWRRGTQQLGPEQLGTQAVDGLSTPLNTKEGVPSGDLMDINVRADESYQDFLSDSSLGLLCDLANNQWTPNDLFWA